jgi:hypothetical protein
MMDKKRLTEGDIFYVQHSGKYFFGEILIDIPQRILKKQMVKTLKFFDGCYLVGVYKGIYDEPNLPKTEYIIPSIYTFKKYFYSKNNKIDWHFYKNEPIDYKKDISFPESLQSVHGTGICFRCGELQIPTKITENEYENGGEYEIMGTIYPGYYAVINFACHYGGRDDLMSFIPYCFLEKTDLRFSPDKRKRIYNQINEKENISYYEMALKHGFDLGRFYE